MVMQIYRAVTQRPRVLAVKQQNTAMRRPSRVCNGKLVCFYRFPLLFLSINAAADDRDTKIGVSGRILTILSWLFVLVTMPFSFCICFKVMYWLESFSTLWMCLFLFYYVTHSITILKRTGVFVVVCRKQSLQEYSRLSTQIRWCRSTSVPSYSGWDVSSPAEPRDLVRLHSRNIASHTYIIQDFITRPGHYHSLIGFIYGCDCQQSFTFDTVTFIHI